MPEAKSDTKNVSVLKQEDVQRTTHKPNKEERDVLDKTLFKFRLSRDGRNTAFENFDGDDLITYIEDSVRRYNTNFDTRDFIEDWQARVHVPFTRNKVTAVLGKIVEVLPIAEFVGRGDEDLRRGQILSNLYDYSEDIDEYEKFLSDVLLEAIVKGTSIAYEGHEKKKQSIRDVVSSGDDIKIRKNTKKTNRLFGEMLRLEDFYPSSVGVNEIRKMPYCFWRVVLPYNQFLQDFASYGRASLVSPMELVDESMEHRPFYLDYIAGRVGEGEVEVIRYYNKDVDEYVMIANGVWLNPLLINDAMEISPLPFDHKELPFWEIKFESFGNNFFYGKSLPDKLKSMQDVLNVLSNMLLDQSFLTIFPPLLTNGFDSIEDDYLRPGRRIPVDTQGLSLSDSYQKIDLGTPTGWHQFILSYTQNIMEEASLDKVSQGVAGQGDRTTAQEIRVAAEGVASMLGLFARLVKSGIKRKAMLRGKNILQFWTDKDTPVIEQVLGPEGVRKMNKAFNTFKIDNTIMTSGKRGAKIIEMFAREKDMPTKIQAKARAEIFKLETGKNIEIVAISPEYIREIDFDIKLIANPKTEQTRESEKAMHLEKARVYLSFFPELVDKQELAAQTAEKMGDDPTKIFKEGMFAGIADEGAQRSEFDNGMGTKPEGNLSNNIARGLRGGEQGSNDLQQLQGQLAG